MSTSVSTIATRRPRRRLLAGLAGVVAAGLALTGCAAGGAATDAGDTGAGADAGAEATLTLSVAPVLFAAQAQHAIDSGLLADVGITATIAEAVSPAETWPQLLAGQLDLAVMDLQQAILARSEGAPIVFHAPVIQSAEVVEGETFGFGTLMVAADSPINTLNDLEGRTIGVNSMGNQSWLDVITVLDRAGVNIDAVEFVEIPAPRAVAALQQGQVDSIVLGEPFGTAAVAEAGLRSIARVDTGVPGVPSFAWVSTEQFAAENADVIARFDEAMLASSAALEGDRSLAVAAAQSGLPYDPAVLEDAAYPTFCTGPLTEADLQAVADRMVKYGVVTADKLPDFAAMLGG